jgi:threonine/homoserine/homoserine lactone efflux protein
MMQILMFYISVFFITLTGAMIPGPMTAVLVSRSGANRFAGTFIAVGHILLEIPLIIMIAIGLAPFFHYAATKIIIATVGGLMVMWMGYVMIKKRNEYRLTSEVQNRTLLSGGIIASLNPMFFIYWATAGSVMIMQALTYGKMVFAGFMMVHSITDILWCQLLSFIIFKTHKFWSESVHKSVFATCGILLIGFGVYFLSFTLKFL